MKTVVLTAMLLLTGWQPSANAQSGVDLPSNQPLWNMHTELLQPDADTLNVLAGNRVTALAADTLLPTPKPTNRATWRPNAKRAMWLELVIPGAGQVYNRKYWKLPLVYGGFMGCIYAMRWNNMMYRDYSQAYLDILDSDPNTQSYNQFLHLGTQITEANMSKYTDIFKKRKDRYRRWRDLSFFCMLGVYALSVIDAYVDASLSEFDISNDLSLQVQPVVMPAQNPKGTWNNQALGLQCSLRF